MSNEKQIVAYVYYREIPESLLTLLSEENGYSYTKDGVMRGVEPPCPRMTVRFAVKNTHEDGKVLRKLEKTLMNLESNNQLVSYTIID